MHKNLKEFISVLEASGELIRIKTKVDPQLEIAEITDRESKQQGGGRALMFENCGGCFPVVTNIMGSDRRIAMALGVTRLDEITERIDALFDNLTAPKPNLYERLKMLPLLGEMSRWLPVQKRGKGECQDVILRGEEANLDLLPILKCWPADAGRFVTLPLVHTLDPNSGTRNVGMYRMQVFDQHSTGMHWHTHKTGERHYRAYKALGRKMPIAVCLGGDPIYTYSATAPVPDNIDEYLLAGFLRRRPVELVRCVTSEIYVPRDCDFVIEGYIDPMEQKVIEGPFGDHTGFYSLEELYPKLHITAITHRRDAIYPATIVGVPPQEDAYIAKATEKIFLSPIRRSILPEIKELYLPTEGVAHNIAIANIQCSYPGQGLRVISSLWGAGQMMFNKFMIITSVEGSVRDAETIIALLIRLKIRDLVFSRGVLDVLDHTANELGVGGKLGIDLTSVDLLQPVAKPIIPDEINFCGGVSRIDSSYCDLWHTLIVVANEGVSVDIEQFINANKFLGIRFVLLFDASVDTSRAGDLLWVASSNCDPSRDITIISDMIILDARVKAGGVNGFSRRWPNVVASSLETIELVDRRWTEYGLGKLIESPSVYYASLQSGSQSDYERSKTT